MSAIHELRESLLVTESAQFVTTMLRDISATRLQAIRTVFEANRTYYQELHGLTTEVHTYAARQSITIPAETFGVGVVYVAVTSNKRFYGHINKEVIEQFVHALAQDQTAAGVVIGQTGQQLIARQTKLTRPVSTTAFAGEVPTTKEIMDVVTALHPYRSVYVVHPRFVNSFSQTAVITDITHDVTTAEVETEQYVPVEYIYEPDIIGMLHFFRTQIRFVLFDRTLLETRLALTGARLMKMQRARERARELVKRERREIHKVVSSIKSMRLLETFSGFKSDRTV